MRTWCVLLAMWASGCIASQEFSITNEPPNVAITAPPDGSTAPEGAPLELAAQVSDDGTQPDGMQLYWTSDVQGALTGTPEVDADILRMVLPLGLQSGPHLLSARVVDGFGESTTASVQVEIEPNDVPVVSFVSPGDGDAWAVGDPVEVLVQILDDAENLAELQLQWNDIAADAPANPDSTGLASVHLLDLPVGSYQLSVSATDPYGAVGSGTVAFRVLEGDADADGFVDQALGGDDCDDSQSTVNPSAPELCDLIDNNCDGSIDGADADGAATWYLDGDRDGHGWAGTTTASCTAPPGYTSNDRDCNDGNPVVSPDADELCDGIDNDCSGKVDDGPPVDALEFFADADGDGFGDVHTTTTACEAPAGFVVEDTDCDDENAGTSPAAQEVCDQVDNDCDNATDEGLAAPVPFYADEDGDGFGDEAVVEVACEPPHAYVDDTSDCDDGDASVSPDADELCDEVDNDCDGDVDEDDATDAEPWYRDLDFDEFGSPAWQTLSCEKPWGHVRNDDDCDDFDPEIHPDATEVCDWTDNDCDDTIDEPDAVDAFRWFLDADDDGYGLASEAERLAACFLPAGYSADDRDCDDTDEGVYPGAPETCDGEDDDCDLVTDEDEAIDARRWFQDVDRDGFAGDAWSPRACSPPEFAYADNLDCNDLDEAVNPDATEVCDGIDNNCADGIDETTSEDAVSWFRDADIDLHGNPDDELVRCEGPEGYVPDSGDCDDEDPASYAGAPESCDGIDQNCDGEPDDDSAWDAQWWYKDGDSDGWGDPNVAIYDCDAPQGYVADHSDCDDEAYEVKPGADELCADSIDNDCDGAVNEPVAVDGQTYWRDFDHDSQGDSLLAILACNQPDGYVANALDCDDAEPTTYDGAPEACDPDDVDEDCDGSAEDEDPDSTGKVTYYLDFDDDGFGDADVPSDFCDPQPDHVADDRDCNDALAHVNPLGTEVCDPDDEDEDCDEKADNADTIPDSLKTTWYFDFDRDGFGRSTSTKACDPNPTTKYDASEATDCNDSNSAIRPGVDEIWYDNVDQNCDGLSDYDQDFDGVLSLAHKKGRDCDDTDDTIVPGRELTFEVTGGDVDGLYDAIAASCDSDEILLDAGTWTGVAADMEDREVDLIGAGVGATILDGDQEGPILTASRGRIAGMSLRNGLAQRGAGIYARNAVDMTLEDLEITDNVSVSPGGGISLARPDAVTVRDVVLMRNRGSSGGGIDVESPEGPVLLDRVTFEGNAATRGAGIAVTDAAGSEDALDIQSTVFRDNTAQSDGGALYAYKCTSLDLTEVSFESNSAQRGGAFYASEVAGRWQDISAFENFAFKEGVGYAFNGSGNPLRWERWTVASNETADKGSTLLTVQSNTSAWYENLDLRDNRMDLVDANTYVLRIRFVGQVSNLAMAGNEGNAMWLDGAGGGSSLRLDNATLAGNDGNGIRVTLGNPNAVRIRNAVVADQGAYGLVLDSQSAYPLASGAFAYSLLTGNAAGPTSGMSDPSGQYGNLLLNAEPGFSDTTGDAVDWDLHLVEDSELIDMGDPALLDADLTRSDIGAYGGPGGSW